MFLYDGGYNPIPHFIQFFYFITYTKIIKKTVRFGGSGYNQNYCFI